MAAETIHTCSYSCERPECIRAQRDELAARLTTETSNARGEWTERYACNGPEGTFWTDDAALANKLIAAAFDRDEWTVTDTQNPTGATPPPPADADEALDRMRHAPNRLWMADLVGQKISVDRMRDILSFALAAQHQEPTTCKHHFVRDEDHGGACCQLCGEVRQ